MSRRQIHTTVAEGVITFDFEDLGTLTFHAEKASKSCRERAEMHGWAARLGDAAALGKDASKVEKKAEIERLIKHYESGTEDWSLRKPGRAPTSLGKVVAAMVSIGIAKDTEDAIEKIHRLAAKRNVDDKEAVKIWAETSTIKLEIARMDAVGGVDAQELLDEMA